MRARFFPWRLFRRFVIALILLMNVSFLATVIIASSVFDFRFFGFPMLVLWGSFFLFSLLGSFYFAYRFSVPLRRVIMMALRLANKKQVASYSESDDDLFEQEPGEYFELEQALDKIRRKLKKRRLELAHEREESQALMSSLQEAVVSIGKEGQLNYFNSRFATLFLQPEQMKTQNEGQPILFTNIFRDPELLKRVDATFVNGGIERFQQKMPTMIESQGRFFSIVVSPLREEKDREIYGVLVLFHDISELKKAEQIRIEFVENASHELRTPLTSIKGFLATAREDLEQGRTEDVPKFLGIISKSVERLNELVTDMLTLSSLENTTGLQLEMVNPDILTQEVFEQLGKLASEKKILMKLVNEAEPFKADAGLVERALTNLLGNSIKYIQEGGQIEVRWKLDEISKVVLLRVKDNGPGISEEHLDRLFERFYRIDKSRNREVGGTGLGLAIVKHIMQTHGGEARVTSKPGVGAEFICEFPFR